MLKELVFIIKLLTCIYDTDNDQRKSNVFHKGTAIFNPLHGISKIT